MMGNNRYYRAMSLAKQIGIAILATISLALFGIGSYYASRQLFPDPEQEDTTQVQTGTDSDAPTVSDLKNLEPQNMQTTFEENEIILSFETVDPLGSTVYVTTDDQEQIDQAMKDYRNGIPVAGRWFTIATPDAPTTTHLVRIPKSMLSSDGSVYYYVLLRYGDYWLPYGEGMDYENGPYSPYVIKE